MIDRSTTREATPAPARSPAATPEPVAPAPPVRIVPLLMAIIFISHFNRISMSVAGATYLIPELEISPVRMGWVYSIFLLFYTLNMTPAGLFADRAGPWLPLLLMLVGTGVLQGLTGSIGFAVAGVGAIWVSLLVVRAGMGFFTSPLHPSAARTVANWFPPARQSLANGIIVSAAGLGIASTIYIFGWLMDRLGWPAAFLVTGIVTLVIAALWAVLGGDTPTRRRARVAGDRALAVPPVGLLAKNRSVVLLTISYTALGYFEYIFFFWMQYYFGSVLQLDSARTNLYSTIPLLAFAVGMPIGGSLGTWLERRLGVARGRPMVPFIGMLLSAAGLAAGILVKDPAAVVACFSIAMLAIGTVEPLCWTSAVQVGGRLGTAAAGLMNTGGNFGGFLAPILTPWLSGMFGWGAGLGLGALICFVGALCWRWMKFDEGGATTA